MALHLYPGQKLLVLLKGQQLVGRVEAWGGPAEVICHGHPKGRAEPTFFRAAMALGVGLIACTNAAAAISISETCLVTVGKQKKQLDFYNCPNDLKMDGGLYANAYRKKAGDRDLPFVVFVAANLNDVQIWPVRSSPQQFFQYKNTAYYFDADGTVFSLGKREWVEKPWKFQNGTEVIQSDGPLIVCAPRSLSKEGTAEGSCQAPEKNWAIKADWSEIRPKMCGAFLTIQDYHPRMRPPFTVARFDPEIGKEVARASIMKLVSDICAVSFERLPAPQASK